MNRFEFNKNLHYFSFFFQKRELQGLTTRDRQMKALTSESETTRRSCLKS